MVIWCEIQVLEGVMEFFWVSGKGSWNVRENGFRKSVATLVYYITHFARVEVLNIVTDFLCVCLRRFHFSYVNNNL